MRHYLVACLLAAPLAASPFMLLAQTPPTDHALDAGKAMAAYYAAHAAKLDAARRNVSVGGVPSVAIPAYEPPPQVSALQASASQPRAVEPSTLMVLPSTYTVTSGASVTVVVDLLAGQGPASVDYALVSPGQDVADAAAPHGVLRWAPGETGKKTVRVTAPGTTQAGRQEFDLVFRAPRGASLGGSSVARIFVVPAVRPGISLGDAAAESLQIHPRR